MSSASVDQIFKTLLSSEFARAIACDFFSLQETCSSDVQNVSLPGCVFLR